MVQIIHGPIEGQRSESADPVGEPLTDPTSAEWGIREANEFDQLPDFYAGTHGTVLTGVHVARPGTTLIPADGDVQIQLLGSELAPSKGPSSHALQEWEGLVIEVGKDEFVARLIDVTAGPTDPGPEWLEDEEAVIPFSEIDDDDRECLCEGSVFRWVIGYRHTPSGSRSRISDIVFRDLPAISSWDIARGEEWAKRVSRSTLD